MGFACRLQHNVLICTANVDVDTMASSIDIDRSQTNVIAMPYCDLHFIVQEMVKMSTSKSCQPFHSTIPILGKYKIFLLMRKEKVLVHCRYAKFLINCQHETKHFLLLHQNKLVEIVENRVVARNIEKLNCCN